MGELTTLHVNKNRTVGELQVAFSDIYAYLKLELFENSRGTWKKLSSGTPLKPLKNSNIPEFEFSDSTIVSEFESSFLRHLAYMYKYQENPGTFGWNQP